MNKLIKCLILFLSISVSIQDVTQNQALVEKFKITQIEKGEENKFPLYRGDALIKLEVFTKKDNKHIATKWTSISLGNNSMPKCFNYVIPFMNLKERVVIECPKEYGYQEYEASLIGIEKHYNEDLIFDFKTWVYGDSSENLI